MTPEETETVAWLRKQSDVELQKIVRELHVQDPAPDRAGLERQLIPILVLEEQLQTYGALFEDDGDDGDPALLAVTEGDRTVYGWFVDFHQNTGLLTLASLELDGGEIRILLGSSTWVRWCYPPGKGGVPDLDWS